MRLLCSVLLLLALFAFPQPSAAEEGQSTVVVENRQGKRAEIPMAQETLEGGLRGFLMGGVMGENIFGVKGGLGGRLGLLDLILLVFVVRRLVQMGGPDRLPPELPDEPVDGEEEPSEPSPQARYTVGGGRGNLSQRFSRHREEGGAGEEGVEEGLARIKEQDPAFDAEYFLEGARKAYVWIQRDFAEFNPERLRPLLTDAMWRQAREQADHLRRLRLVHVMEDIQVRSAHIAQAWVSGKEAHITVHFRVEMTEYKQDAAGKVVDGDRHQPVSLFEGWTFVRSLRVKDDPNWQLSDVRELESGERS